MLTELRNPSREISICQVPSGPVYALEFDGVNDICIPQSNIVAISSAQALTAQFEIAGLTATGGVLFDTRTNTFNGFVFNSRGLQLFRNGSSNFISKALTSQPAGRHIITLRYDGGFLLSSIKIYVDGVEDTNVNTNSAGSVVAVNSQNDFRIGGVLPAASGNPSFFGELVNFSIVDYAKSDAEILADAQAGTQSAGTGAFLRGINYSFNIPPANQSLVVPSLSTAPDLDINGQTAPGDWVCIENCI